MAATKHIVIIVLLAALIVMAIIYPFMPGEFDPLAVPVSILVQGFGLVGLPLVLLGLLWLIAPKHAFMLAAGSMIFGTFMILVVGLVATLSVGKILGILALTAWSIFVLLVSPKLKSLRSSPAEFQPTPIYLVVLPLISLGAQFVLVKPVTNWSRDRAIEMATQYIEDIEKYHSTHGSYPATLHAQHKDYQTNVVGVEKYFYALQGEGFNLSFEQPRFLLDRFGTREWVVYNPRDENRMYSHVSWLMPASDWGEGPQGWYDTGSTKYQHWRWFYFD
jgi:hypothetical protein